ncbi:hypothetical protein EAI_06146 [Harpegnathos saltator]|uniref:Adenylate cyclase N-terminal domain-containing protein n=1 Tax=Harpegnathos saltator TaxID=610380 RepID=E2C9M4_HARSA|nr:hypothetical protein EAI_06146 [Harpegnathos saltator]
MEKYGVDFPKREWSHRLSLRGSRRTHEGEIGPRTIAGVPGARGTRRWASLRQHVSSNDGGKPRVELLFDTPGSKSTTPSSQPHTPNTPKTPHTPIKKSNWEMARGSEVGVGSTSGRETMAEAATNAGITQSTQKCALSRFLSSLCASHRFKNLQVEMLYQRYFLRMNQSNMTHVLGLLAGLVLALGLLLVLKLHLTDGQQFFAQLQRAENLFLAITLVGCIVVYAVLVVAISRPGMNEIWLAGVSGMVLVTLLALQVTLSLHLAHLHEASRMTSGDTARSRTSHTGGPLAAALAVCFFIYMAYALLPIRLRHACIAGVVFSVAHIIGAFLLYPKDYPAMVEHGIFKVS